MDDSVKKAGTRWAEVLDRFKPLGKYVEYSVVRESPDLLPHYLMRTLAHAYIFMSRADPDYPEFIAYSNIILNLFGINPDAIYWITVIDGTQTYRIFGQRETVHEVNFLQGSDFMGMGPDFGQAFHGSYLDDYEINPDGSFEILVCTEKPVGYSGNWMPLNPAANFIFVRNIRYRPGERDPRMAIERLSQRSGKPRPLDFDKVVNDMVNYVTHSAELYFLTTESLARQGVINRMVTAKFAVIGGSTSQIYENGLFEIGVDEALIVSIRIPPECTYWNFQVSDLLLQDPDYMRYQSHLNGHIDRSDSDGITRLVLSQNDPGLANWIDLVDVQKGYMVMRLIGCNETAKFELKKVAFADIGNHLPKNSKYVSPEQRETELRNRFAETQLRRYW